tara:strand:- start:479 stop:2086 length:1608 start_codon:yes stop_codon:yes gene_type:complete
MVVASLILITRYAGKKTSKQETIDVKEAAFDIQPIKNFVTECLSSVSKDAIKVMGKQGGYLFTSQGGTLIDYRDTDNGIFFVNHENSRVVYNILKPRYPLGNYYASIPNYPWKTFPYTDESKTKQEFQAKDVFGTNNLPPLNKSFGQHSMQEQLIAYITKNIDSCLDFSIFAEEGFEISKNENNVAVDINDNDVTIRMNYELIVENLVSGEKTELNNFIVRHKIRLGKLHAFVNKLIENDISDIEFNIAKLTITNNFEVDIKRDVFKNDDLIIITDKKSSITGLEFKYFFARKNRNPAIFYLTPASLGLPRWHNITNETLIENYPSSFKALDPDEDSIDNGGFSITPKTPIILALPKMEFQIKVTDGELEDYQIITVNLQEDVSSNKFCNIEKANPYIGKVIAKAEEMELELTGLNFLGCNQKNPNNFNLQDNLPSNLKGYDGIIFYNIGGTTNSNTILLPSRPGFILYAEEGLGSFFTLNLQGSNANIGIYTDVGNSIVTLNNIPVGAKYELAACGLYTLNSENGTCPVSGIIG